MNAEHKIAWVKALRSGDYIQGSGKLAQLFGSLKHVIGYCCLGIACEVFQHDAGLFREEVFGKIHYDDHEHYMPIKLVDFLGLRDVAGVATPGGFTHLSDNGLHHEGADVRLPFMFRQGIYTIAEDGKLSTELTAYDDGPATLARCNDAGCTFDQIADLIENML